MVRFLKKYWAPLVIFFISAVIFIINHKSGTFLSGWDTLHPEFDFSLNIKRVLSGVWRLEQGFGAVAGHSHMADLPRILILWLSGLVLPLNLLRYFYIFLMFLFGGLGAYYLISYLLTRFHSKYVISISFISSLLYLFNFSTIQNFFVPFEMFPTQFGFLPWILLYSFKYLDEANKKNLILFSIFILFSTPQAYAAHLWYAFFGIYTTFLLLFSYLRKKEKNVFKKSIILILLTLFINSFWLFPNIYYVLTSSSIPRDSKQNRLFSQEYTIRNREHGNIQNVALLKGFYFNWSIHDYKIDNQQYLMQEWRNYTNNWYVNTIGYFVFLTVISGFFLAIYKNNKALTSLSPLFIIPFILLMNNTFPFDKFFDFLLKFNLFNEALRFVYNKFIIILSLSYVIYFSYFLSLVLNKLSKNLRIILCFLITILLLIYIAPVFTGNLISDKVQVKIPNEYFRFWDYMKNKDDGTVLALPIYNLAGWEYYNWGYQGAGFIWFGLKQPILVRDFDRWSRANEQVYREFHYSLYSRNSNFFESNLDKYNIKYVLWDKNIISPDTKNRSQVLYTNEIGETLNKLKEDKKIKKVTNFNNLYLYELNNKNNIRTVDTNKFVWPKYTWSNFDYAYYSQSDYITFEEINKNNILYPLRNFVDERDRIKKSVLSTDNAKNAFQINIPDTFSYQNVNLPSINKETVLISDLSISKISNDLSQITLTPLLVENIDFSFNYTIQGQNNSDVLQFNLNGRDYSIKRESLDKNQVISLGQAFIYLDKDNFLNGTKLLFDKARFKNINLTNRLITKFPVSSINISADQIYRLNNKSKNITVDSRSKEVFIKSKGFANGLSINIDDLPHYLGYAVIIKSRNISGLPLRVCLKNSYSDICTLYDELSKFKDFSDDIFLVPPSDQLVGYVLSLDNISYGNFLTENSVESIKIIPFPYSYFSQIYAQKNAIWKSVKVLINNQSFHNGWSAFIFGKKLSNHVLVNNWANGWVIIDDNINEKNVVFVFLPQYLEYLGFGLLIFSFVWVIFWKKVD